MKASNRDYRNVDLVGRKYQLLFVVIEYRVHYFFHHIGRKGNAVY